MFTEDTGNKSEDQEEVYFWECEVIYDFDGDLIALVLLWAYFSSLEQSIYMSNDFFIELHELMVDEEHY